MQQDYKAKLKEYNRKMESGGHAKSTSSNSEDEEQTVYARPSKVMLY